MKNFHIFSIDRFDVSAEASTQSNIIYTKHLSLSATDYFRMEEENWRVVRAHTVAERQEALAVRHEVFVKEQGVPVDREQDAHDENAIHFVAYDGNQPVGAARLREYDDGVGKIERVAVRADRREEGWGRRIMAAIETAAQDNMVLRLDSQRDAIGFYEQLGYDVVSEPFMDAGIPHRTMIKHLD